MSQQPLFHQRSDDDQRDDERLARLEHGPDLVNESVKRWKSYTQAQRDAIMAEGNAIYADIAAALSAGKTATDADVQALLKRWHQHIYHFYEPSLEIMAGLGEMYALNPDFRVNFEKLHADLPEFLRDGIAHYVDELETQAIAQMLDEDDARRRRLSGDQ